MAPVFALLLLAAPLKDPYQVEEEWTRADTLYQMSVLALVAADWAQTFQASRGGRVYETNRFLGRHPPALTVHAAFLSVACLHTLVALALPPEQRRLWQVVAIGFEASSVSQNLMVGVGFRW